MYKNCNYLSLPVLCLSAAVISGCVNVATQTPEAESYAKQFNPPPAGWSGLYIYRTCSVFGAGLKKSLYVDGQFVGETSRCRFFYRLLKPGVHKIQTESEFSENGTTLEFREGVNHFIQQYIKLGVFVAGANLEIRDEAEGRKDVSDLSLAENRDNRQFDLESANYDKNLGSIPGPVSAETAERLAKNTAAENE